MDFGVSFFGDGSSPGFTSGRPLTPPFPSSSYSQASVVQNLRKFTPPDDKQFRELQIKNSHYQNETRNILRMIQAREKERREAPLTVYVPPRRFPQIFEALNYPEEQRWPRCNYNAVTAKLAVTFMPSPIHEAISSTFLRKIYSTIATYPAASQERIEVRTNEDVVGFAGKYTGSRKIPDVQIKVEDQNGNCEVKVVVEVGFAESYEDLVEDARLWLDGQKSVSMVILAKFTESPPYRNPLSKLEEPTLQSLDLPNGFEVRESSFVLMGDFGPANFKELSWVGQITTAFMELWKRNPITGLAERVGERFELFGNDRLSLRLSQYLDLETNDHTNVTITAEELRRVLKRDIRTLARIRYADAVDEKMAIDPDYHPDADSPTED